MCVLCVSSSYLILLKKYYNDLCYFSMLSQKTSVFCALNSFEGGFIRCIRFLFYVAGVMSQGFVHTSSSNNCSHFICLSLFCVCRIAFFLGAYPFLFPRIGSTSDFKCLLSKGNCVIAGIRDEVGNPQHS